MEKGSTLAPVKWLLAKEVKQGHPKANYGLIFSMTDRRLWVTGAPELRALARKSLLGAQLHSAT